MNRHKPVVHLAPIKLPRRHPGCLGKNVWISPDFDATLRLALMRSPQGAVLPEPAPSACLGRRCAKQAVLHARETAVEIAQRATATPITTSC